MLHTPSIYTALFNYHSDIWEMLNTMKLYICIFLQPLSLHLPLLVIAKSVLVCVLSFSVKSQVVHPVIVIVTSLFHILNCMFRQQKGRQHNILLLLLLLTLWSRVLPEKLTCPHIVKKFPAFCVTRMFITAFTRAHYLSLS